MIDFKQKDKVVPSALIVIALVIMAGATVFDRLFPVPAGAAVGTHHSLTRRTMSKDTKMAETDGEKARKALMPKLWQGNSENVSAGVLALLTNASNQHSLKLGAFRPQRPQPLGAITELPYTVQVNGPYPGIRTVMTSLDATNSKIVLRSAQIASSEQGTNAVSATLGVSAYLAADPSLVSQPAKANTAANSSTSPANNESRVAEGKAAGHPSTAIKTRGGTHG
jgi:hypothetical protein